MAVRIVWALIVLGAIAGRMTAQPPKFVPEPAAIPVEAVILPAGTDVSRPLTTVQPEVVLPTVEPPPGVAKAVEETPASPGRKHWDSWDFLLWWNKAQPMPALVTAAPPGVPPTLGSPSTRVLVGGQQLATGPDGGGRFVYGSGPGEAMIGYEAAYMFLGGNTGRFNSTDVANRNLVIARPFFNAALGQEDAVLVTGPAGPTGYVDVATSTRVSSWEVNGVGILRDGPNGTVMLLAGYRYFRLKDGLHVEQAIGGPGFVVAAADQFDTHNHFHGAQVGIKADYSAGPAFIAFVGKVALGQNNESLSIGGRTNIYTGTSTTSVPGGILALASNSGRYSTSTFAVLPEAQVKVGFRTGDHSRFSVGYNLIYLNDAVRPGDQIDRVLDPSQFPPFAAPADRPAVPFKRTDFWVQGLVFSWDTRY